MVNELHFYRAFLVHQPLKALYSVYLTLSHSHTDDRGYCVKCQAAHQESVSKCLKDTLTHSLAKAGDQSRNLPNTRQSLVFWATPPHTELNKSSTSPTVHCLKLLMTTIVFGAIWHEETTEKCDFSVETFRTYKWSQHNPGILFQYLGDCCNCAPSNTVVKSKNSNGGQQWWKHFRNLQLCRTMFPGHTVLL